MRADRLISIILLLQNHRQLTAAQLAGRLDVSERTILRDMDALSGAGVPVRAARGTGGGWSLLEGYRTRLTGLTSEEVRSLFFSRPPSALSALGLQTASESAWMKLQASLGETAQREAAFVSQRILVDPSGWRESSNALTALPTLMEALWRNRQVRFEYESALKERGERLVHPLGLVVKGSVWYLVAHRDGEHRTYRVSRMGTVSLTSDVAERPEGFDLTRYWEASAAGFRDRLPEVSATYRVRPAVMRWIRYKGWRLQDEVDEGDWIRIRLRFDSEEEVIQLALSHGADIELLEPAGLRRAVVDAATQTADRYAGFEVVDR